MKIRLTISTITWLVLSISHTAFAKYIAKQDTIYYLLDTASTSAHDRLFTFEADARSAQRFYTLNCPCLEDHHKPRFRYNDKQGTYLDARTVSKLPLISLPALIELVTINDTPDFYNRFVIYFIIREKRKYAKHKVFFLSGHSTTVE